METTTIQYKALLEELQGLLDINEELLLAHGATMKNIMNINICLEEMFVNIAHYAYEGKENKGAVVSISFDGDDVLYELVDEGIPFDPLAKADPDTSLSAEERDIGGLGIYMVKKSMDKCTYDRKEDKNIFTMRKNIKK